MSYRVNIGPFEGPLDLLIYLIKRDELNIYDIPIAHITKEYLAYIEEMHKLDLNIAGDFLIMAAILLEIKAKMLLPSKLTADDEEFEDPRQILVDKVLQYKHFKELTQRLLAVEAESHLYIPISARQIETVVDDFIDDLDLSQIIETWMEILQNLVPPQPPVETTPHEDLDHRIEWLLTKVKTRKTKFTDIIDIENAKQGWIVSFLALLESCKRQKISSIQPELFGSIWLWKKRSSV